MGYISLSHCKDAIIIVWHKNKIGIDIERKDRDFNHVKFAEKYFFCTNKSIHNKKKIHLNYSQINFHNWTISLAYEEKTSFNPEIICCSKNF